MRRNQIDLVITAAIAVAACAAAVAGAPVPVLAVLGVPLFAAPGYVLAEIVLGNRVAGLERAAVAGGLALAVPVLGGLVLYAVGAPLHRTAWAALLAGVTLAGDAVLAVRRARRPHVTARPRIFPIPARHAAAFTAAVLIAAGGVGIARVGAAVQHYPGFTQLWLSPGQSGSGTAELGVSNHEGRTTAYRLVLVQGGRTAASWKITLANGASLRRPVTVSRKGATADLYRVPDLTHPYRSVTASGTSS